MKRLAGIYGDLSAEAVGAYLRWEDALLEEADHVNGCSECSIGQGECGKGIALYEHEQAAWDEWRAARTAEGRDA